MYISCVWCVESFSMYLQDIPILVTDNNMWLKCNHGIHACLYTVHPSIFLIQYEIFIYGLISPVFITCVYYYYILHLKQSCIVIMINRPTLKWVAGLLIFINHWCWLTFTPCMCLIDTWTDKIITVTAQQHTHDCTVSFKLFLMASILNVSNTTL